MWCYLRLWVLCFVAIAVWNASTADDLEPAVTSQRHQVSGPVRVSVENTNGPVKVKATDGREIVARLVYTEDQMDRVIELRITESLAGIVSVNVVYPDVRPAVESGAIMDDAMRSLTFGLGGVPASEERGVSVHFRPGSISVDGGGSALLELEIPKPWMEHLFVESVNGEIAINGFNTRYPGRIISILTDSPLVSVTDTVAETIYAPPTAQIAPGCGRHVILTAQDEANLRVIRDLFNM